ncbi:MAG TPA: phospho-sugar mutase [Pirellulaceae bacterium]|nr:phospho-sugar mutase [Planctomycetales bacterium]MCB9941935.1 phospho-sugar mutase [Planctomycetaceae bacterium]HRX80941.1 phospho-sugar mutase [Pirellulaceae bacterium]
MTASALEKLTSAPAVLTEGARDNIRKWLSEPRYSAYAPQVIEHIEAGKWQELDDAFWTVIPFGTGGRRGRMYPIGSNAINDRTIGESAQGLAEYVKEHHEGSGELSCALAYDTRHNSRHFAELCAGIMVAAGFKVYFLDDYRSTPELSYLVRHKKCSCGIMVTASHNPPSDNAVKVYWSTGAQILPPHDKAIIDRVMNVQEIKQAPFDQAVADGNVIICTDEIDAAYIAQVKGQRLEGPRDLKVIFSPLHGVGSSAVCPSLEADGFTNVEVFADHAKPDGDFPNVPGHVSNPENPAVFDSIIVRAKEVGADLILASDPDCDRMGVAAPVTTNPKGDWRTFTGNQLGALLIDYVLERRSRAGTLTPEHYVVKTLVTTEMGRRIADSYNVTTYGNLHVGFKWIAGLIDEVGPEKFVFGTEESHGYMAGTYVRDKDGGVACMLMAELAACVKAEGKSLHEKLESLWWQHGYHAERTINVFMEGSEGMSRMNALMAAFRAAPPKQLGGIEIAQVRDYQSLMTTKADGSQEKLDSDKANMVILDLAQDGNYIAVRPSGTEPKVKFYMFTFVPAEQLADLETTAQQMEERMDKIAADVQAFADAC